MRKLWVCVALEKPATTCGARVCGVDMQRQDQVTGCLFGLSATSQQYFSQKKPAITNQSAVLFSQNKSAPAISHQPNEQAVKDVLLR
jgi:hypothetical protein